MKKDYTTPTLKVVEFKAECGFAASGFSASPLVGGGMEFEMILMTPKVPAMKLTLSTTEQHSGTKTRRTTQ